MRNYTRAGSLSQENQFVDEGSGRVVGASMEKTEVLICPDCGALVADTARHDHYHRLSSIGLA